MRSVVVVLATTTVVAPLGPPGHSHVEEVADQGVKVAFYRIGPEEGAVRLELLEPTRDDSPIARFLERRGEGLHHVAYTVDDIQARLDALKAGGVRLLDETPRPGAHHTQIAFLHPRSSAGVLTEHECAESTGRILGQFDGPL